MPKTLKRILIITVSVILGFLFVHMPLTTPIAYEAFFQTRYETPDWLEFSVEDFDGLTVERSDFSSGKTTLAGYKYKKGDDNIKGVVVVAHGMGGGHNWFMPYINYFADNGYYVFAYDAHGNDNSGGKNIRGLPQGIIDLDLAIRHVKGDSDYTGLPIMLFGHSWGGYSAGNVLEFHNDIAAAVIVAGFNESEDIIRHHAGRFVGPFVHIGIPYVDMYERLKFGNDYARTSAIEAMRNCDTGIMIVQGGDDTTVPSKCGYDKMYEAFYGNERFEFHFYSGRDHKYIFYSDDAYDYIKQLEKDYLSYVKETGKKKNAASMNEFMSENLDSERRFEINYDLCEKIIKMYDKYSER